MSVEGCENMEKQFIRGDIVRNNHAGDLNKEKYLLYLKKGTIRQGIHSLKTYDCLSWSGGTVRLFRCDADIEKVGHMHEFDAFLSALKMLAER